jgi:hypothetical protein
MDSLKVELIGGFISPVHAAYGKKGLAVICMCVCVCEARVCGVCVCVCVCVCVL